VPTNLLDATLAGVPNIVHRCKRRLQRKGQGSFDTQRLPAPRSERESPRNIQRVPICRRDLYDNLFLVPTLDRDLCYALTNEPILARPIILFVALLLFRRLSLLEKHGFDKCPGALLISFRKLFYALGR
jgi:hypothetical protein